MPRKLEKHHKNQRLGGGCNQAMEEDDSDPFREQDPNSPRAEEQLQSTPDGPGDEEEEDDDEEEEEYNEDEDDQSSLIMSSHVKRNDSSVSGSSKTFSKSKKKANRCEVCRKKVGLTGFTCRCGGLYCALHRYSDKHECDFDYKKLGAEEIRKNNPVIEGEKIHKI